MSTTILSSLRMNGFQLKCLALILMIIDHIHQYIPYTPIAFNWIGRIVAPIFFYLMVEGFRKTSNRSKYILRMWIAGVVMGMGSEAVMLLFPGGSTPIVNNIFISLGCGLLLLQSWEWAKSSKYAVWPPLLMLFAIVVGYLSEASYLGIAMTIIFYALRHKPAQMAYAYIFTMLLLTVGLNVIYLGFEMLSVHHLFYTHYQWMMIGAVIPILLYNGQRGYHAAWAKYMFYIAYPVHIWLLYLISRLS